MKVQVVDFLFNEILNVVEHAKLEIYRTVNYAMVQAYWNIGRMIVEEEQNGENRAVYGKYIVRNLSDKLTRKYGAGFDKRNLYYMTQFYQMFPIANAAGSQLEIEPQILNAPRSESQITKRKPPSFIINEAIPPRLSWTHFRVIMRVKNVKARNFYINEAAECGWSTRQLDRQINSFYFERLISSKSDLSKKKDNPLIQDVVKPENILKDPMVLEFLQMKDISPLRESDLEQSLINKLQEFLLELGKGFAFVARQQRISTDTKHFYLDLVFYNYLMNCFVLIDLKTHELTHQDIGQMDMYVRIYEQNVKPKNANPTIGLILCADKDESMARYSILEESKQIFASKYQFYLPSEEELTGWLDEERSQVKINKILDDQKNDE